MTTTVEWLNFSPFRPFSILEEERLKWQKVGMRAEDIAWIEEAAKALEQEPIKLEFLEEVAVV